MMDVYSAVQYRDIEEKEAGQRLDNFLLKHFPGVPKSRIYQMLRKGEVRCNKKRVKAEYKIQAGDRLRIPPLHQPSRPQALIPLHWREKLPRLTLYEDDDYWILNKPGGLAVHGGSGMDYGLIEIVQALHGADYAQLAHRIDRDTTGILVLAKHRRALLHFQEQLKNQETDKHYLCLVQPRLLRPESTDLLLKRFEQNDQLYVGLDADGKRAITHFRPLAHYGTRYSLIEAKIETGRTHQIRASLRHLGRRILGDEKYGDREQDRPLRQKGLEGMFLHAHRLAFELLDGRRLALVCPLSAGQEALLQALQAEHHIENLE